MKQQARPGKCWKSGERRYRRHVSSVVFVTDIFVGMKHPSDQRETSVQAGKS
jgi:hypothetical protein